MWPARRPPRAGTSPGPGGRGWLPTPGSRRSGRAQLGHPAPRTVVSLRAQRAPPSRHFRRLTATCRTSVATQVRLDDRSVCPHGSPGSDPPLPSTGSPWGEFPDFVGTISGLRLLDARPAALRSPSLGGTTRLTGSLPQHGPCSRARAHFYRGRPCRVLRWKRRDRPGHWAQVPGRPLPACPALRPRRNRTRQTGSRRPSRRADGAFHSCHSVGFRDVCGFRGSITRPARLPVYASQTASPLPTQHSVPAGWSTLAGRDSHPLGR